MTNHAYLDRLTALFLIASCGGLSADHGQKRELGGVTITGGLDLIGPITEEGRVLIKTADVQFSPKDGVIGRPACGQLKILGAALQADGETRSV
jgi:hypothetical protein